MTNIPTLRLPAGKALNDMHRYDPANRTWTEVDIPAGSAPAARAYAGVAEAEGLLYLFGGSNGTGLSPDSPHASLSGLHRSLTQ